MPASFVLDATLFERHAIALRARVLPVAAERAKAFLDHVMDDAKAHIEDYYSAGGQADPSGPNPGELRDSGYVDEPKFQGTGVMIEAGFGKSGPASKYALFVHEGHHLIAWGRDTNIDLPPTKFWETPLMEAMDRFPEETGGEIGSFILQTWGSG